MKGLTLVVIVPITLTRRIPKFCSRTRERFVIDAAETKPSAATASTPSLPTRSHGGVAEYFNLYN